nr:MAG TPA: LysW biosynthesis protein LysW [Caudoviricetes sp.]
MTDVTEQKNIRQINCNNCLALNNLSKEQVETGKAFACHHCGGKLPMKEFKQAFDMSNETWEEIRQERLENKKDPNKSSQPTHTTVVQQPNNSWGLSNNDASCMGNGCGCLVFIGLFLMVMSFFGAFG